MPGLPRTLVAMSDEDYALLCIRVLRRDGYRCRWKAHTREAECGAPAPRIGPTPVGEEYVALCLRHYLSR